MARGWESKSIESQQADAASERAKTVPLTPEAAAREALRRQLNLARSRVLADLTCATAPAHRQMLEHALSDLDTRIGSLDK